MMAKTITTQTDLLQKAQEFSEKYPGRGFQVTTREWYNDAFEIRANPSIAKALVKQGKLRLASNVGNSANYSRPVYYLNGKG